MDVTQGVIDIKNDILNVSNETAQAVNNIANKIDGFNYSKREKKRVVEFFLESTQTTRFFAF